MITEKDIKRSTCGHTVIHGKCYDLLEAKLSAAQLQGGMDNVGLMAFLVQRRFDMRLEVVKSEDHFTGDFTFSQAKPAKCEHNPAKLSEG